ncbi:MAG: hypothetical protein M0R17_00775 [Candidatus Omnitrophica bacterium]|jgi:hypothetical protein|nr:hypothetical protein [Candidatus Omnitrophota bacterium]
MKICYNGFLYESKNTPTVDELKQKYEDDLNVYFSYRSINKIGINPKSEWRTPNGIYAYNIDDMGEQEAQYTGGDRGYVYFIKPNPGSIKLDLQSYNSNDFKKDLEKLKQLGFSKLSDAEIEQKSYYKTPGGYIWYVTMKYSTSANSWNAIFRKMGYDYVVDHHMGIIHSNEPAQAVFLNPSSFTVLDVSKFDNSEDKQIPRGAKWDVFNYLKINNNIATYKKLLGSQMYKIIDAIDDSSKEEVLSSFDTIKPFYEYCINVSPNSFFSAIPNDYKVAFALKFKKLLDRRFSVYEGCMQKINKKTILELTDIFNENLQKLSTTRIDWAVLIVDEFSFDEYMKYIDRFKSSFDIGIEKNANINEIKYFVLGPTIKNKPLVDVALGDIDKNKLNVILKKFSSSLIAANNTNDWISLGDINDESLQGEVQEYIKQGLGII